MKVTIEKDEIVIRLPLEQDPQPSSSGKTLIVAGTGGFTKTDQTHLGKPVSINVCATVKR